MRHRRACSILPTRRSRSAGRSRRRSRPCAAARRSTCSSKPSTRTQSSFEIAGKRLGADVMNMSVAVLLGEEGRDADRHGDDAQRHAARHPRRAPPRRRRRAASGAEGRLLGHQRRRRRARASDPGAARRAHHPPPQGPHRGPDRRDLRRHPAFARRALEHHPAATRSARACASSRPRRCCRPASSASASRSFTDMREGLDGADIVMMLRLQRERMNGSFVPSVQRVFPLSSASTRRSCRCAKPDALVMHPGPMNRGVEISSEVADGAAVADPRAGRDGRRGAHGGARGARQPPAERMRTLSLQPERVANGASRTVRTLSPSAGEGGERSEPGEGARWARSEA